MSTSIWKHPPSDDVEKIKQQQEDVKATAEEPSHGSASHVKRAGEVARPAEQRTTAPPRLYALVGYSLINPHGLIPTQPRVPDFSLRQIDCPVL